MVKEEVLSLTPRFAIYKGDEHIGHIIKRFTLLKPKFDLEYCGWQVEGNFLEWDYSVTDQSGRQVMRASKDVMRLTDTYVIDIEREEYALDAVMIVLAIDAAKASASSAR